MRKTILILTMILATVSDIVAQDKIVNPEITYAGNPRSVTIGGLNVSGIEGYEDYMLLSISSETMFTCISTSRQDHACRQSTISA